jgi:hypothetical protein
LETSQLIHELAGRSQPVRRLASPWRRAAVWLAISAVYAVAVIFIQPLPFSQWRMEPRFAIEQIATIATAVTAAIAAFWSVVPGSDRRWVLLPLVPLAVWLMTLGETCVRDWRLLGWAGLAPGTDWDCVWLAAVVGFVPAAAIVAMLRRGAPLVPRASLALAAVAVAAFANFVIRLHHPGDLGLTILAWHFGMVAVLACIAGLLARHVLKWPRVEGLSRG